KLLLTSGDYGLNRLSLDPPASGVSGELRLGAPHEIGHYSGLGGISVDRKSETVALVSGREVQVLDLETMRERLRFEADSPNPLAELSADGRWCAASGTSASAVRVLEVSTGKLIASLPVNRVSWLAFSSDNQWLVSCGLGDYRFWRTASWTCACSLQVQNTLSENWGRAAFSPDGRMAAIAYSAQLIRLVDPATGNEFATLEPPQPQNISSFAFSPDGGLLAVTTSTKAIQLWDLRLLRNELAAMNLDWDLRPGEAHSRSGL
ncbi:MAG: WD40 repeat domain-containing protein, partial [Limisphaerales bacterium]